MSCDLIGDYVGISTTFSQTVPFIKWLTKNMFARLEYQTLMKFYKLNLQRYNELIAKYVKCSHILTCTHIHITHLPLQITEKRDKCFQSH